MVFFNLYSNKIPTDLLFFVLKILIKATLLENISEYTPEAASNLKKDNKYYNLIKKRKASDKKKQRQEKLSKLHSKREAQTNPTIFPLARIPTEPIFPTAAVPKFALNTYVSIISDTSLRGYLCNKIQGIVCVLNR